MKKLIITLMLVALIGIGWESDLSTRYFQVLRTSLSSIEKRLTLTNPSQPPVPEPIELEIGGEGGIVVDRETGIFLFGKNEHQRLYPASTTKIMTALVALEEGNLDDEVVVSPRVVQLETGSKTVYLQPGDRIQLEQLLYGLLLESGNDCAIAIAEHVGGTEERFIEMMNERAKQLGVKDTHFTNPHGLHHRDHYSTPNDLGIIARTAFDNPVFQEIIQTPQFRARFQGKKGIIVRDWVSTNQMFHPESDFFHPQVLGAKTGYTGMAQYNLVSFVRVGGRDLVIVVLKNDPEQVYVDTLNLLEAVN